MKKIALILLLLCCKQEDVNFNIYVDCDSKVFINDEKIELSQFKEKHKKYCLIKRSDAEVRMKVCTNASIKPLTKIRDEMKSTVFELRKELSIQKFNRPIDSLSDEELKFINEYYPLKLIYTPVKPN